MTTLRRYTPEEDRKILKLWWDPRTRDNLSEEFGRSKASINFRYYSLLKKLGINPGEHRLNQGAIPEGFKPLSEQEDIESSMAEKLEELEEEMSGIHSKISNIEKMLTKSISSEDDNAESKLISIYEEYKSQVDKNKQMYNELDYWLGQFFKLNNVEKLSTLRDFLPKIKTIIQKYSEEDVDSDLFKKIDLEKIMK